MKMNKNIPPQLDKNSPHFDNTTEDYIIDDDIKNNVLTIICSPFNLTSTNNTSGNIYGNIHLTTLR